MYTMYIKTRRNIILRPEETFFVEALSFRRNHHGHTAKARLLLYGLILHYETRTFRLSRRGAVFFFNICFSFRKHVFVPQASQSLELTIDAETHHIEFAVKQ